MWNKKLQNEGKGDLTRGEFEKEHKFKMAASKVLLFFYKLVIDNLLLFYGIMRLITFSIIELLLCVPNSFSN